MLRLIIKCVTSEKGVAGDVFPYALYQTRGPVNFVTAPMGLGVNNTCTVPEIVLGSFELEKFANFFKMSLGIVNKVFVPHIEDVQTVLIFYLLDCFHSTEI